MRLLVTGGSGFIGTNFIDVLIEKGVEFLNVDIKAPNKNAHNEYWAQCDILDREKLLKLFQGYKPSAVLHLAARTDTDGMSLSEYLVNTEGTANVLAAIKASPSVARVVITSTQFVHQTSRMPAHDQDFMPHTVYGESKVITEKLTRDADLDCIWTIIRPTNIWGPWHPRYPHEFWRVLGEGKYFHPGGEQVTRSYGYVKNIVYQINSIFDSPPEKVKDKVFYVGDSPINLLDWVNGFSLRQTGKEVKILPRYMIKALALLGDVLKTVHVKFPITSSRFKSMTTSNSAPMDPTLSEFGMPPYALNDGIAETVNWLKEYYPHLVKNK